MMPIKTVITALTVASLLVLLPAKGALASDLRVTVYITGGIIVGGVSIFWAITIGGGDFSKKEKDKGEEKSPAMFAYNAEQPQAEDYSQAGLIKILKW